MSIMDYIPKGDSNLHTHPLPAPDKDYCSCCRMAFVHGYQNVVQITQQPETLLDFNGNKIGTKGEVRIKANYHAKCFQDFHYPSKRVIECKYCGIFSMAKKLKNGQKNGCICSCHKAGDFCSLIITAA